MPDDVSDESSALTRYACKFCICLRGLKGADVPGLPQTQAEALQHVTSVHGYPQCSAETILGDSPFSRAAARLIEQTGPVSRVRYFPNLAS
jgi:hypothetical protein